MASMHPIVGDYIYLPRAGRAGLKPVRYSTTPAGYPLGAGLNMGHADALPQHRQVVGVWHWCAPW